MTTYKIIRDTNNFQHFNLDLKIVVDTLGSKFGRMKVMHYSKHNLQLKDDWKDFECSFMQPEGLTTAQDIPDISTWRLADLVLSGKAYDILHSHIENHGEFLPVNCDGETYYIFNCLTEGKEDESKSDREVMDGVVMEVNKLVFDESDVADKLVFKSLYQGATALFCNDKFKDLVQTKGLRGITFSENLLEMFS